jgi:hypothetical protein
MKKYLTTINENQLKTYARYLLVHGKNPQKT